MIPASCYLTMTRIKKGWVGLAVTAAHLSPTLPRSAQPIAVLPDSPLAWGAGTLMPARRGNWHSGDGRGSEVQPKPDTPPLRQHVCLRSGIITPRTLDEYVSSPPEHVIWFELVEVHSVHTVGQYTSWTPTGAA